MTAALIGSRLAAAYPDARCDLDHLTARGQGRTTSLDHLTTLYQAHHRLNHTHPSSGSTRLVTHGPTPRKTWRLRDHPLPKSHPHLRTSTPHQPHPPF